jgi:hypothetical protein
VTDISLRWLQLDEDADLEAILVTDAPEEAQNHAAYVFDHRGGWNLVGSFFCGQWVCDTNHFIEVQKLTEDSPALVIVTRDLGGSATSIMTTEAFQLREGKLWPVLRVTDKLTDELPPPHVLREEVLASKTRLVIHTVEERPPGHAVSGACEVRRWDGHTFVAAAAELRDYCDPKTGRPNMAKLSWAGLPIYP